MSKEDKDKLLFVQLLLQLVEKNNTLEGCAAKDAMQREEWGKREDAYRNEQIAMKTLVDVRDEELGKARVSIGTLESLYAQQSDYISKLQAELSVLRRPKLKKSKSADK